jgi:hypothetical protein
MPTAAMARARGISRPPVYAYLRRDPPPRPKRPQWRPAAWVLPPSVPSLLRRWRESGADSLPRGRAMQERGEMHSTRTVCRVITQRRRASAAGLSLEAQAAPYTRLQGPSARAGAFALVGPAAQRSREAQVSRDQRGQRDGAIARAHARRHAWLAMVRERRGHALEAWMADAIHRGIEELARCARGRQDDLPAIKAGRTLARSNGVTEGQMPRLQLGKRQGDGLWRALGDAGDRQGPRPRRPQGGVPLGACPTLAHVSVTRVAPALDLRGRDQRDEPPGPHSGRRRRPRCPRPRLPWYGVTRTRYGPCHTPPTSRRRGRGWAGPPSFATEVDGGLGTR